MKERLKRAGRRARNIAQLVKVNRGAKLLARTGFKPAATWVLEAQGLAPSTLLRLRGHIAALSGCEHPGGCATTAIRISSGDDADPLVFGRLQLLSEWTELLNLLEDKKTSLERTWGKIRSSLENAKKPWGKVSGPISAVIATLMDVHWKANSPWEWIDSDGELYDLRKDDPEKVLRFALRGAFNQAAWERASARHFGKGTELGVDHAALRRSLARFRRRGDHAGAAVLEMVATASLWPAERRFGAEAPDARARASASQGSAEEEPFGSAPAPSVAAHGLSSLRALPRPDARGLGFDLSQASVDFDRAAEDAVGNHALYGDAGPDDLQLGPPDAAEDNPYEEVGSDGEARMREWENQRGVI